MPQKHSKVLIYTTAISKDATPDDKDVLDERDFVLGVLQNIGYGVEQRPFDYKNKKEINEMKPSFIFNLVEAVDGKDSLAYLAPENFERLGIPYTGCTKRAFFDTKDKVDVKKQLRKENILTPYWLTLRDLQRLDLPKKRFLIKSKINHASKDLEAKLVEDMQEIKDAIRFKGDDFFAEEYIEGREFNVSIVGPLGEGRVLPLAEIIFSNWSPNKLKIVDYAAKWDETSHEYHNTDRTFNFSDKDKPLLEDIEEICKKCWNLFDLRGYARVDFRVDEKNKPYVLEINTNPCISSDAGFIAAAHQAGMTDEEVIKSIIKDSCGEKFVL
jgi:D-alanine-D-alanine ligase